VSKKLELSDAQFNHLSESVLMKLLDRVDPDFVISIDTGPARIAKRAVEMAAEFEWALRQHYRDKYEVDGLTAEEVDLLRTGKVIACIKSVRERSNMNLKDAKTFVDKFRQEMGLL